MTRITGPHLTAERLVAFVHAQLMAIPPRDEVACVILYRSELAMLETALDTLTDRAEVKATREALDRDTHQRASLGDYGLGRLPRPWGDQQALESMTEEELLRGLEDAGYTEPSASTRPKEYGAGKLGPVEIRRPGWPPSACGPSTPSCLPAFWIVGRTPDTDASTGPSVDAVAAHTDRTAAGRTRSVRRGLGET